MEVIKNHHQCEDPINYLGFEELSDLGKDCLFFYGGHANQRIFDPSDKPKYFFSTEEQEWDKDTTDKFVDYCDTIFTICPGEITGRKKRKFVFFPFNENYIPKTFEKKYDAIYTGLAGGDHVSEILSVITKFNYRFVSFGENPCVTNNNVPYEEKIRLVSESKIAIVHSLTGSGTQQIKTRPFEAAFCKALILCKRDNYNIIEKFFTPNQDFLYYQGAEQLESLITEILKNYEDYSFLIENAFNKAINNYTTRYFIQRYLA